VEKKKKVFLIALFISGLLLCPGSFALAADFGLSSGKSTYEVGESIPVRIYVASPTQASNAVSGVVSFPTDKFQVASLSKTSSVVNMWVQEPSYFNADGQVNFEGVVLNPGYKGSGGTILTVNFKARTTGTAKLSFANGSILANDGEGTNILKKLGQLSLTIVPASVKKETPPPPAIKIAVPAKPIVVKTATTSPLDITPPEQLAIIEIDSANAKRARFSFSASDELSGIDHYQFSVDDLVVGRLPANADIYETPGQVSGIHRLTIMVVDKAGNSTEQTVNFEIKKTSFLNLGLFTTSNGGTLILILVGALIILLILVILLVLLKSLRRLFVLERELTQVKAPIISTSVAESPAPKSYQETSPVTAKILFRGKSELTQAVVLLRNGQIVAETKPGADNIFEFTLDNLPAGFQHFSLVALEAIGNPSLTQDYPVMLSAGASIVVSGIEIKLPRSPQKDFNYSEPNV
jgi:hypothetical protein